jgi:hypothetical protein
MKHQLRSTDRRSGRLAEPAQPDSARLRPAARPSTGFDGDLSAPAPEAFFSALT